MDNQKTLTFVLVFVLATISFVARVSAVECGTTPTSGCTITQNTTFNTGLYNFSSGVSIEVGGITLDCNNSIITGTSGTSSGVFIVGNRDGNTVKNCHFKNFTTGGGIFLRGLSNVNQNPQFNLIYNNTFEGNKAGVYLYGSARENDITSNLMMANTYGVLAEVFNGDPRLNTIHSNRFIDNIIQAQDNGLLNKWNTTSGGNYWNDYDSESEGCFDADSNLICDASYNLSGTSGSRDYLPTTGIQINEIIPVQVVRGVDLVWEKTTLVRSILKNTASVIKNVTVHLYFEGNLQDTNSSVLIGAGEEVNVDLWFAPNVSGSGKEIEIEVLEN